MSQCDVCQRDVDDGVACKDCGGAEVGKAEELRIALRDLLAWVDHQKSMGRLQVRPACSISVCDPLDAARRVLEKHS